MSERLPGSFRDPSGFMFEHEGRVLRQVNHCYAEHFEALVVGGLYEELVDAALLVPHRVLPDPAALWPGAYCVLEPEQIPFLSYPYEWSFTQLKDAALATLEIQRRAIEHGMVLKDASAYNIQFCRGRPTLIDTLSFEEYSEGMPWTAYGQFCRHFLAPLLLMAMVDVRLVDLMSRHIDGIPLDLASGLLPSRTLLRPGALLHLHLHARSIARHAVLSEDPAERMPPRGRVGTTALKGLISSLEGTVRGLRWASRDTEWSDYEDESGVFDRVASEQGATDRGDDGADRPGGRLGPWLQHGTV